MKSITKTISLLLVLSTVLILSSCLDSDSSSYVGNEEYSYITRDEVTGLVYARTVSAHYITSPEIALLTPGTVAYLSFAINDETEKVSLGNKGTVYKVISAAEPKIINQEGLYLEPAFETDTQHFESLMGPPEWLTQSSGYFGDRWPFNCQYKAKKGEEAKVSFFLVEEKRWPENLNADILIDVRMKITGTPQENAKEELMTDLAIVDLSLLIGSSPGLEAQETKRINIKYRYYRLNFDKEVELHISNPITITVSK